MRQRVGSFDHHRQSCEPTFDHRRRYRSDLSDTAWARIAGFLVPKHFKGGRLCPPHRWREYLHAMLYVLGTGCAWRHLPNDFAVSWSAAHKHFLR
jgi:putative transposase